tara:strand:+ start:1287 stop:2294 length:1008 start_codon:yes stop_codon:yes gene_type:complete
MKILVTGSAGFIGSELCIKLLEKGITVIGVDNHNNYYDPALKEARLERHLHHKNYSHLRFDISDRNAMEQVFSEYKPQRVVNLAAQAGVRHSIDNPDIYIQSNLVGFANILECCRQYKVDHYIYASSSSVYGANLNIPYSTQQNVDHPLSLYAASKKSNELMAHAYSHLYNLPTTGLRFFTVYGPWGRPDMAPFKFTQAILSGNPIPVFNNGNHKRDFTYIDDIIDGIMRVIDHPAKPNKYWQGDKPDPSSSFAPWSIYNIGNSKPVTLLNFIKILETALGKRAALEMLPMQAGDMLATYADVVDLGKYFHYKPKTSVTDGIEKFVEWYRIYFDV